MPNSQIHGQHLYFWMSLPTLLAVSALFQHMHKMPVQFERYGERSTMLEIVVKCLPDGLSVTLKPEKKTRGPDAWSLHVHGTLHSWVPSMVDKCTWSKVSAHYLLCNMGFVHSY